MNFQRLTENTFIPIGLAVVVIGGGAAWMTNIAMTTQNLKDEVEFARVSSAKKDEYYIKAIQEVTTRLQEIRERLIVIETELKRK